MISKPVDLIVANVMHKSAACLEALKDGIGKALGVQDKIENENAHDAIARGLLVFIAQEASMTIVYELLKQAKAPHSANDIREGLQAIRDRQKT